MGSQDPPPLYMMDLDEDVAILPKYDEEKLQKNPSGEFLNTSNPDMTSSRINYARYSSFGKGLSSIASLSPDGCIDLSLDLKKDLPELPKDYAREVAEFGVDKREWSHYPHMNIVIMIVGSRGDVQPFVALGKELLKDGHRIRIASHETFRSFVTEAGLEFFDIGGNPHDMMSYMVKNPGLMPGFESLTNGDISRKRKMLTEMMNGCWLACHSPCSTSGKRFAADVIISNPPAFAHIHCAEALGIPLLLSFTMPWSPTTAFPHPLVNIKESNAANGLTNYISYAVADLLIWQGIGDLINTFRTRTLGLPPLNLRSGPSLLDHVKVPWTYCMSPALVPKPDDWKSHIDVVGFYFLDLAVNYKPPDDLAAFLAAGEPPIYIGFGSIVVDDPLALTKTIFEATAQAGVRVLISAGWGGLGNVDVPPHVFILGNVPHDWLFDKERVTAIVHHGGAGTTAIGLAKGRPTAIVPFFGDQSFWASMIHKSGAGPKPITPDDLNVESLRDAIRFVIAPPAKAAAKLLAEQIREENGVQRGVESFYKHLPLLNMRCDLGASRLAIWWSTEYCLKLSAFAAQTLIDAGELNLKDLDPHRSKEYETRKQISDPATGGVSAIFWTITHYYASVGEIFVSPVQGVIHTATAIPHGIMKIVASVHEGFQNVPTLYGSDIRKPGKVTDLKSGITEGAKGLFYGYYDGITGLVREPMQGAQKEGFAGVIKGSLRSYANVTMRPAAGILGLVTYPVQGAWMEARSAMGKSQERQQVDTRVLDGKEDVRNSTRYQREEILRNFKEAKKGTKQRHENYKAVAEELFSNHLAEGYTVPPQSPLPGPSTTSTSTAGTARPSTFTNKSGSPLPHSELKQEDEDAVFVRELELAKQLSLEDDRAYQERNGYMHRLS